MFPDLDNILDLLDISEQQGQILSILFHLEEKGHEPSPLNIQKTYTSLFNRELQRPNVFSSLRFLAQEGLISKAGRGIYHLDPVGIKSALKLKEATLAKESNACAEAASGVKDCFKSINSIIEKPHVEYIDGRKKVFDQICKQIKQARKFYIVARFPGTSFTPSISREGAERGSYLETAYDLCFKRKKLEITYLTPLYLDYAFSYAMVAYDNKELAYRECETVLNNLENQVAAYDNLDVRYSKNPFGFDVAILEMEEPRDMYIWVRDNDNNMLTGAFYIRSVQTATQAIDHFTQQSSRAPRVQGPTGAKLIQELRDKLAQRDLRNE